MTLPAWPTLRTDLKYVNKLVEYLSFYITTTSVVVSKLSQFSSMARLGSNSLASFTGSLGLVPRTKRSWRQLCRLEEGRQKP